MFAYAVFDKKAIAYNTPFFCATDGLALRAFGDLVQDAHTVIAKHPEDFALYRVGSFNVETGVFTMEGFIEDTCNGAAVHLAEALAFVPPVKE